MSQRGNDNRGNVRKLDKQQSRQAVRRLVTLTKPFWAVILICCLLGVLLNVADLVKPYIMKIAVDEFLTKYAGQGSAAVQAAAAGKNWFFNTLVGLGVTYFLVILIGAGSSYLQSILMTRVCQRILHELRLKVFDHIHRLPLRKLDAMGSGRLLTRATNDIEALDEFYGDVLLGLFKDVFLLAGIIVMMLNMNWRLALTAFAVVPLIAGVTIACRGALRRNFVKMKALIGQINGFIAESLSGIRVIQAFNREKEKYEELRTLNLAYRKTTMFQVFVNSFLRPVMEVLNSVGIVLVLIVGYRLAGREVAPLEVGVLVAFNTYIKQFFEPINDLAEKYNTIQSSLVSAERIFTLLDDDSDLEPLEGEGYKGEMRGEVEFRNVWFAYVDEDWVLKDMSFHCNVGEKFAFVGATGAGKTTIISLLSRFYEPQKGEILIDGIPIQNWQLQALRSQIGVVLQDVFLFAGTVADNVRINAPIDDSDIEKALEKSCAIEFVEALPGGMQHTVAERGATFSTGERQLLSFARAIAHDPKILVLDEATANIDSNTEALIQKSIQEISAGRTSIYIAHRLSTIRNCDQIYYLDRGTIVEHGTHDELMFEKGRYYELVMDQA